jgi:hypothetical protein
MSDSPLSPALQELVDRMAIDDLITQCTMAIDNAEWDEFDAVFTADAVIDFTSAGGIRGGLAETKQWLAEAMAPSPVRQHLVGSNKRVMIDGDTATVRAYVFNPMYLEGPDKTRIYMPGGSYHNYQFVRTDEGWRGREFVGEVVWREVPADEPLSLPDES